MHDPVSQRVDGQLRDAEEVLPGEVTLLLLVQGGEAGPQALDLAGGDYEEEKRRLIAMIF